MLILSPACLHTSSCFKIRSHPKQLHKKSASLACHWQSWSVLHPEVGCCTHPDLSSLPDSITRAKSRGAPEYGTATSTTSKRNSFPVYTWRGSKNCEPCHSKAGNLDSSEATRMGKQRSKIRSRQAERLALLKKKVHLPTPKRCSTSQRSGCSEKCTSVSPPGHRPSHAAMAESVSPTPPPNLWHFAECGGTLADDNDRHTQCTPQICGLHT